VKKVEHQIISILPVLMSLISIADDIIEMVQSFRKEKKHKHKDKGKGKGKGKGPDKGPETEPGQD
jgi:hypothetical protein